MSGSPTLDSVPADPVRGARLSWAQERMWFLYQLHRASAAYNLTAAWACHGALELDGLEWALNEVIRRHEILRSVFDEEGGVPKQYVLPTFRLDLEAVAVDPSRWRAVSREHASRPFDLSAAPPVRAQLLRLADDHHILQLTLHHILADGWSLQVLQHELVALYGFFVNGEGVPPPALPLQYREFAQHQRADGEARWAEHVAYWKKQFSPLPPTLEIPTDRPRAAARTHRGAKLEFQFEAPLREALEQLARAEGATLFMILLLGYAVLLARYCHEDDVTIGTPVAHRPRPELEALIGCFVNTLPLRVRVSASATVRQLLARVRGVCLEAYAHQEVPFERLVQELRPERRADRNPLFQSIFGLQTPLSDVRVPSLHGLRLEPVSVAAGGALADLTFALWKTSSGGLAGWAEYSTDLFDHATVERLVEHWRRLLGQIAANPDRCLDDITFLDEGERRDLVQSWNAPAPARPARGGLHRHFERQAARTPDAAAITAGDTTLTYAVLNARANGIARRLRSVGVTRGARVGICLDRGPDLVPAILGVLKAGAAYVPMDPNYPDERLAWLARDARIAALVSDARAETRLGPHVPRVVVLDEGGPVAAADRENLDGADVEDDVAYVIYTSGSTGTPKGVPVTHRNVVDLMTAAVPLVDAGASDVWTLFHSVAFDFSVWEIWGALLYGGRLVVVPYGVSRDPAAFYALLREEGVTILSQTPSAFQQLMRVALDADGSSQGFGLRTIVFGGEALDVQALFPWLARFGDERPALINMYGITETTVHVTLRRIRHGDVGAERSAVGRGMPGMHVYVLDDRLDPVPLGVPGEIYVGGTGVARGYWDLPALTASRFVPDPFESSMRGARLYRTGDLGRWRAGGDLEYLGRADQQVKLRGHRIELGEIEATLRGAPGVGDAVVALSVDEAADNRRLVAYFVPRGDAPAPDLLRAHLAARLPDYMVPSIFVPIARLPLTVNGKIDRRALPAPTAPLASAGYVAPRTGAEEILCGIWARVLGVERVGVEDHFFERGGDSIRVLQVVALAREAGLRFTVQQMLEHQTIASLLVQVGGDIQTAAASDAPLPDAPLSLSPMQHWFFEQPLREPSHWNQSLLLAVPPGVTPELVQQMFEHLVGHHDALRLRFRRQAAGWTPAFAPPTDIDGVFARIDATGDSGVGARFREEAERLQASLNLERGPLVRAGWFDVDASDARLLVVIHHLAVDGVSWRILLQDLAMLWEQASSGQVFALPRRTASTGAWVTWLVAHATEAAVEAEFPWWEALAGDATTLPRDGNGGDDTAGSVATLNVALGREETAALLDAAGRMPLESVLLTAVARTVAQWTGRNSVRIDVEGHGREVPGSGLDLTRTVGWFTTIAPMRLTVTGGALVAELEAVASAVRSMPRKGVGFGQLRYLHPDGKRRLAGVPPAPIALNYLGRFEGVLPANGWQVLRESAGSLRHPGDPRPYLLEISVAIDEACLRFDWFYSQSAHKRLTITALAEQTLAELRAITSALRSAQHVSPADFPLARVSQATLDRIAAGRRKGTSPGSR
jgi:amino acid adenylation domain-containing protein/non-ribosomal peptide synthase protein (TIGR01720 family)